MTIEELQALGMDDAGLVRELKKLGIDTVLDGTDSDEMQRRRRRVFDEWAVWTHAVVSDPHPDGPKLSSFGVDAPDVHEANRTSDT